MTTMVDWVAVWARKKPKKTAMAFGPDAVSYEKLSHEAESVRRYLRERIGDIGNGPGSIVIIAIGSLQSGWPVMLAARALGFHTVVTINPIPLLQSHQSSIRCVVALEDEGQVVNLLEGSPFRDKVVKLNDLVFAKKRDENPLILRRDGIEAGGHFLLTSASTGAPKAVFIEPAREEKITDVFSKRRGVKASSKIHIMNYGISSSSGYRFFASSLKSGASVIYDDGVLFEKNFYSLDFNHAVMRPAQIDRLYAKASVAPPVKRPGLTIHFAGGFVSFRKISWILQNITTNVYNDYGASEYCGGFALTRVATADDLLWHKSYADCRLEIVDDAGAPAPVGIEGAVRVKLESHDVSAYFEDPQASQSAFRDGYFYPGDMAIRREDGRFRLLGRVSDVLVLKSEKYPVAAIEAEIEQFVRCSRACVFSSQNDNTSEIVVVALEMTRSPSHEEVEYLRSMFQSVSALRIIDLPSFPMNESGKTDRRALRSMIFGARV